MSMDKQKFKRGDVVHIAEDLGSGMSHFENDIDAIILGSYADQYGGVNFNDYTVMFVDNGGECSWYRENQLSFIKHVGEDGIIRIKETRKQKDAKESDMEWILDNWTVIRKKPSGATMGRLMELVVITNPWGSNGEGFTYYSNMQKTYQMLDPILSNLDVEKRKEFLDKLYEHTK